MMEGFEKEKFEAGFLEGFKFKNEIGKLKDLERKAFALKNPLKNLNEKEVALQLIKEANLTYVNAIKRIQPTRRDASGSPFYPFFLDEIKGAYNRFRYSLPPIQTLALKSQAEPSA